MNGTREDWFPTSIWYFDLESARSLNTELLDLVLKEKSDDTTGLKSGSSVLGWNSQDSLHSQEAFHPFIEHVLQSIHEVTNFAQWNLSQHTIKILNCWAMVNG